MDKRSDRLLFERNPLPMFVVDAKTMHFLAANQAAVRAYGWSEAEFRTMTIYDIRPPEDRAPLRAYVRSRPAGAASPAPTLWRHQRRNGEVFDVEVLSDAIDFQGQAARLVMARDISALRRAEAGLLASERRYRSIVENASEGIWTLDTEARTTFVNPAMARMLGLEPAEMLNRTLWDFMDEAEHGNARQRFDSRRLGVSERHELRLRHRDGHEVWTSVAASPVLDERGGFAGAMAVVTDITERKQSAARTQARADLMTLVAGGAPVDAVVERLVHMVEGELPGTRCCVLALQAGRLRLLSAPSLPAFFNQAADGLVPGPLAGTCGAAVHRGERVITEHIATDPAWGAYHALATAAGLQSCWSEPVVGRHGNVLGSFGVYRASPHRPDATELALVSSAAQMTAVVIERRQADEALRESQKMESLGTLAGGIAHDFNNILGAILANLDGLRHEAALAGAARERVDQINLSAQRARTLVQQILAFSRRQPQALRPQPLAPLLHEALALLRASLPAAVRLQAQVAGEPLFVMADATRMQQVLMNLCSNAWHALPPAGGTIEIGLDAQPAAGSTPGAPRQAHLWVRDDGSGMDEATRARIFEPFFTTKPVGRGTGLGLAVVHGIVTEHGGSISVETAPGRGSTFHVLLPLVQAVAAAAEPWPAPPPAPDRPSAGAPQAGAEPPPRHVLCVDDDDVMRLAAQGVLQRLGFLVTTCAGGTEALEAVRTAPLAFDVVVADYNMPDLSGIDLARALAHIRPTLPVLISTGYVTDELRAEAAALGVRGLVHKENTVEELGPAVQRALAEGLTATGR